MANTRLTVMPPACVDSTMPEWSKKDTKKPMANSAKKDSPARAATMNPEIPYWFSSVPERRCTEPVIWIIPDNPATAYARRHAAWDPNESSSDDWLSRAERHLDSSVRMLEMSLICGLDLRSLKNVPQPLVLEDFLLQFDQFLHLFDKPAFDVRGLA